MTRFTTNTSRSVTFSLSLAALFITAMAPSSQAQTTQLNTFKAASAGVASDLKRQIKVEAADKPQVLKFEAPKAPRTDEASTEGQGDTKILRFEAPKAPRAEETPSQVAGIDQRIEPAADLPQESAPETPALPEPDLTPEPQAPSHVTPSHPTKKYVVIVPRGHYAHYAPKYVYVQPKPVYVQPKVVYVQKHAYAGYSVRSSYRHCR